jgi:hypothetical protein
MNRVLVIVEGQTERAVLERVLAPYLSARGLWLYAKILGRPGHKGGIRSFEAARKEILALLKQEPSSCVSTFFDYYGLPEDWPGLSQAKGKWARDTAVMVEQAMHGAVALKMDFTDIPRRFIPYVQMHELEALLFAAPEIMASVFERLDFESPFAQIVRDCGECEEIDDHATSAPSKRIENLFPGYRKGSGSMAQAPIILNHIGMDRLRRACPHFSEWITKLEAIVS